MSRGITVIKSYRQVLNATKKEPASMTYAEDLAVTEFRAFHKTAGIHVERVNHPLALEVLREVVADLSEKMLHKIKT